MESKNDNAIPLKPRHETANSNAGGRRKGLWRGAWLVLALPLLGLGTSVAIAKPWGGGGPGMMHGGPHGDIKQHMEHMLTAVGATDAQKAQVKAVWEGLRPQLKALHQEQGQLHKQMAELLGAGTIDSARVEQLRKQSIQTMDRLSAAMTQGLVSTANVLTPAQRKIALQKFEEMRAPHEEHGEGHSGHE